MSIQFKDGIPLWFIGKWGSGKVRKEGNNLVVITEPSTRWQLVFYKDVERVAYAHNLTVVKTVRGET